MSCPLECEYLQESRRHEKSGIEDPEQLPDRDVDVSEEFLQSREELLAAMAEALGETALHTEGAVDFDVREALAALIRTYRTLAAGIHYETRPENRIAARLYDDLQDCIQEFRRQETELLGMPKTRDNDVLRLLVFFHHFALDRNNGRKRGRAFIDALLDLYPDHPDEAPEAASPFILP